LFIGISLAGCTDILTHLEPKVGVIRVTGN
jgi:hypothetical protein